MLARLGAAKYIAGKARCIAAQNLMSIDRRRMPGWFF